MVFPIVTLIAIFALGSAAAHATKIVVPLLNHPDGNARMPTYGLRIDNLYGGAAPFTFDFDCDDCGVTMEFDGVSIHIEGDAFGGEHDGLGGRKDDDFDGMYHVNVTYVPPTIVEDDGDGLQDIGILGETGGMIGTLEFKGTPAPGEATMWELMDKSGSNPFSLRIGDEDDDAGHRGFDGISGWGWLKFREAGSDDPFMDVPGPQDFLFIARRRPVPTPGTALLLTLGLFGLASSSRRRRQP